MHCSYGVRAVLIVLLLSCSASLASAQMKVDTVRGDADVVDTFGFQMTKSPTLALGLSAILPGAGQIYNEEWWKAPVLYGLLGGFGYGAYIQNDRYLVARDSLNAQLARGDESEASRYRSSRDFYRNDRDRWLIYMGLAYIANLIDAYISAHLFDFDVSDPVASPTEVTSRMRFHAEPDYWRVNMRVRF